MTGAPQTSNSGSLWHRWDPHLHAPGTVHNDQFGAAPQTFEMYLGALEGARPVIRALGITDYYSTETYERVVAAKREKRLPDVDLIFPNIEMRFGVGTIKGRWVNVHLMVSPEDPQHVAEANRFLGQLRFKALEDTFSCERSELIRLGRKADSKLKDDKAAFAHGAEQVKVSFDDLRAAFKDNGWARANVLVAVAGSETDGSSGVRDAADTTLRQEIEKFAHVIFASSPKQRAFWLGDGGNLSADEIRARYGALKPCLHGCDAHDLASVGNPDGKRYSWIKGRPAFDTLRQAVIDPASRACVGELAPASGTPSQVIAGIAIKDAPWAMTPAIELNPGLVAIIGARGSGKTALADVIAHACDATSPEMSNSSFLKRAQSDALLDGASVTARWAGGGATTRLLDSYERDPSRRARYLSQKFVEELCAADGMTDELLREIERVIYDAHLLADRDGALDFAELRELHTMRHRDARQREEETLGTISDRIGAENEKARQLPVLRKQVQDKQLVIDSYIKDRAKLAMVGAEVLTARLNALSAAAETARGEVRALTVTGQTLLSMQDEVINYRQFGAQEELRELTERYRASTLKNTEWAAFLRDYKGDVDGAITLHLASVRAKIKERKGVAPSAPSDPKTALIAADADLGKQPLALLEAEIRRVEQLIGADRETRANYARLSKRIDEETAALNQLKERLTDAEGASARAKTLSEQRELAYGRVFDAILAEEKVLHELYKPLMDRLAAAKGSVKKLSFSVARVADTADWAQRGEDMLDLRVQGAFKGKGTLLGFATNALRPAWERGNSEAVRAAMTKFRSDNSATIFDFSQFPKSSEHDPRAWLKAFAKWLYGTDHIRLEYSIDYDGVDIRKLSPGTRGIVLLLLYLALDEADDRPLIIDQPEENLDPKSIFDELVALFLSAKGKRQVIMVTHNANLVVNTDADQVIVAEAGHHVPGQLPPITYTSGGLEDADIRKLVCNILEGGERAFQERARRLRVSIER